MNIQLSLQEICDFFIQSSDIVYAHTSDGIITYANENIEKIIGYTIEEIKGKHFSEFIHPDDVEYATKIFDKALLQNEHTENFRFRICHKDGRFLHFDFKAHSIFKDGVYKGGIGVGHDVTARLITEEALGKSEEIYKVVVDKARDVIYTVSPEGIVTSVNEFMKNVTGFSAEEVIGKPYIYFIHPDEIEYGVKIHEAIMRGEKPPVFEMRFLKKSGDYLNAEFSTTPLFHEGKFLGTLGIGRDITEKKKNEENLKLALMKERQINELKQHFISMVSHEFRTPLFLISGTAELLENETKAYSDDKIKKNFKIIKDNVKRLSKTLDDIVLLCSENYEDIFKPRPLNVIDMCLTIVKEVCMDLKSEDRIKFSYCEKISQVNTYFIDYEIMRHILTNLLNNAVKYSAGSAEPVEFRIENIDNILKFTISDRGIGIPEAEIKNLFHTFMRASNASKVPGTGIGLALVKKFVDIHKGEIFIKSAVNEGTKVFVNIPATAK